MQKFFSKLLVALMILGCSTIAEAALTPKKGVIRVKLQPEVAAQIGNTPRMQTMGNVNTGITPFDASAQKVKVASIRRMIPYSAKDEAKLAEFGLNRWYEVTFDESITPEEASQIFSETPGVQIAHTIVPMQLVEGNGKFRIATAQEVAATASSAMPFNDPMLSQQWHYVNNGSIAVGAVPGADINLFEAWQTTTGRSDVVVAIIDGGIDINHEDLAGNIHINESEANGVDGVDDDNNGYVDDIYGFNFCTNTATIYPHDHGTHVAGTVAAVSNNGKGVAGVAGGNGEEGSGIRMISCQVFDSRSGTQDGDFASAIIYAARRGASIAQCSWGWGSPDYYEQEVLDAIDYFTKYGGGDNLAGGLCIFATGNNGETGKFYPAAYEPTVAVGAMTCYLTPAGYSNYGPWVDIVAPGGLMDYSEKEGVLSTLPNNRYGWNEGTSMATPHVSGIAALVLSQHGKSTLSNETLRTQLLSSVNDFYTPNPTAVGLFGSGYIDAGKALLMGDGTAPEAVGAITTTAGQDNILIEWTVPNSSEGNVNNHIVYYSKNAFDASTDLSTLNRVNIDTKFLASGDAASYELTGLEPLTTYYLALQAVNRWGDASVLSEVVSATTNAGPKMTVDKTSLSMTIDASSSFEGGATFNIGNDDEGLLKWEGKIATKSFTAATKSVSNTRPVIGALSTTKTKLGITPHASKASEFVTSDYKAEDYPMTLKYFKEYWASIGESDKSLPNSEAQWFVVDPTTHPEGFNLTHVVVESTYGSGPTIQIYDGSKAISAATLLGEVKPSYFYNGYQVALTEQIYFAPGQSFWVVAHFPAEENQDAYPLGLANADATYGAYSYMSNDMGKTWKLLSEALKGSPYESMGNEVSWAISAISKNPAWDKVFTLAPAQGQVKFGEKQEVVLKNDGQPLVNGTYKFNVSFTTNESDAQKINIPATVTVKGNKPQMAPVKVVNFGSLLVGESKEITVELFNEGYGVFTGKYGYLQESSGGYTSSSEHYTIKDVPYQGFPARAKSNVTLVYTPQSSGSHTGTITFKDVNNVEFKITVQGVATDPAKIVVEPEVVEVGDLDVDAAAITTDFLIKNEGNYPLEYVFPKFSNQQLEVSHGKASHKYGYTALTNLNGATDFAYDGNPALLGGTDITSQFSDDVLNTEAISLGFDFPFYGKTYDKVYINSLGGISFSLGEYQYFPPLSESSESLGGIGYITAYGHQLQFGPGSKVIYAKQDGKFVVKYENVLAVKYDVETSPISFRIMLSANGDIEIFYDDYVRTEMIWDDWYGEMESDRLFQGGSTLFCAIKDPEGVDPLVVTSADIADYWETYDDPAGDVYKQFTTQSSVKFEAPSAYFVTAIAPAYSIVNPGESVTVQATLKANDTMYAGATTNRLTIETNDPKAATAYVSFNANITGANLKAQAMLENDVIDFGKVFRTSNSMLPVTIKNSGKAALDVTEISIANGKFTIDATTPFTIEPGMSKDIIVTLPTQSEGVVEDVLTITTTAGDALTATLKGEVIGCPGIEMSVTEISESVVSGATLKKDLTITNTGDENLEFSTLPGSITTVTDNNTDGAKVSYIYKSAVDGDTNFEWIDIETTGLGEHNNFSYYNQNDYATVTLPFEFSFYGKKYTEMYIYNTGFVSFTKRDDQKIWPEPPAVFPEGTIFTNIIAPYWGLHTMDSSKTAGTYHYMTEEEVVVSWMEYGNTMNIGVCFQLIMKKDGSFKFQYKSYGDYAIIFDAFGLAGVANENGSESVVIPDRLIQFNNAVQFIPVVETTLAPNESKTVGVDINTNLMAGTYTDAITINTNIPGSETIELPVSLTVTGEAKVITPTEIVEEHVLGYMDMTAPVASVFGSMGPFEVVVNIENQGTAPFSVTGINLSPMEIAPIPGDEETILPMYQYIFYYGPGVDWMTGETIMTWNIYSGEPIEVNNQGLKISLPFDPYWMLYTLPGDYKTTLMLSVDGLDDITEIAIPITVSMTDVPYAYVNKEGEPLSEVRITNAAPDFKSTETINLANMGAYKLTYDMYLDMTGEGEATEGEGDGGGIAPWGHTVSIFNNDAVKALSANLQVETAITPMANETDNVYDAPSTDDFKYNNALYYPSLVGRPANSYGTGNTYSEYKAATHYVAPEGGFNISHVYFATSLTNYTNSGLVESVVKDVDFIIEIVAGNDYENGAVIGKGTVHIDEMSGANFVIGALDKAVYLDEGQEFYIRISYPVGIKFPAYLSSKEESVVSNRYMGYVEGYGWFDLASLFKDQYGSLGYIMTALETVPGEPWIKLLNETTSGEVAIQESIDINLAINAASAPLEKGNKAMLVIKSNDAQQPVINLPIYLDLNGKPVITSEAGTILAAEGSTTQAIINILDAEGDDFSFSMVDNGDMAKITNVEGATITEDENGVYSVVGADATAGVNITVDITPDYGDEGNYDMTFFAKDAIGNEAQTSISYSVSHTNRAPEAVAFSDITVDKGSTSAVLNLAEMFTDPDGDDISFELYVSSKTIITTFVSGTSVIFVGNEIGTATISVVATDANGASTTLTFNVNVVEPSGVEDIIIKTGVNIYPNPVVEILNVTCNFDAAEASFALYNINGVKVIDSTSRIVNGETITINVGHLADGIYLLKVNANGAEATFPIVKH